MGVLERVVVIPLIATLSCAVGVAEAVAAPAPDVEYTQPVSIAFTSPCAAVEYTTAGGWIRLEIIRRAHHDRVTLRVMTSPHLWYWYGYDTTDPEYDPALPTLGDPDWVYDVSGDSRNRVVLVGRPSAAELSGDFTVTSRPDGVVGPSDRTVVHYLITYAVDTEGLTSATVTDLDVTCPDGTFIEDVSFVSS
ncbi:MAG: hypothetical protein ICV70_04360 [Jiangellaceae bacterium]|nr:hypothetical protein [Jiangellaceae bacterium]